MKYSPTFRDYENAEEMNEKLIELWNSVVTPEDTVYNLGDLSMAANTKKVVEVAKRLNGKHFLILGNHDYPIKSEKEKLMEMVKDDGNKLFEDIRDYKFLTFPGVQIALSLFSFGVILASEVITFLTQYPHSTAKLIVDIIFMIILPITLIVMLKWIKTHFKIERIK